MSATVNDKVELTRKDFVSDQMVKWCPGCGDYAILASFLKVLPTLGINKEDFVIVSGIGCSSRFPYYVKTYGFHGIHGRAAALATGIKITNPDLSVWMVTGDGDSLAIGGNHFIHALRRNLDINIMLFNNRIYGLTKGQYSPTSNFGQVTKTSPHGTFEHPFNPAELAIGAHGTFIARTSDSNPKLMQEVMTKAAAHKGASLIEILQNCVIFNNGAFESIAAKEVRDDAQIHLIHGEQMIFGKELDKALVMEGTEIRVRKLDEVKDKSSILVHNEKDRNPGLHTFLANMKPPHYPVAMGVIRAVENETYENAMARIIQHEVENAKIHSVDELLNSGKTWDL